MGEEDNSVTRLTNRHSSRQKRANAIPAEPSPEPPKAVPAINESAARALDELVALLQKHWSAYNQDGKLGMKVASYRKAAAQLRRFSRPIDEYSRQAKLQSIPGVGPAIAKKLDEFLGRGSFKLLDELRSLEDQEASPK